MLGWLTGSSDCPVDEPTRTWIETRFLWLVNEFGTDPIRNVPVLLPTPDFFPDPYDGSPDAARLMFDRVAGYMRIDPNTLALSFYEERSGAEERALGLYLADSEGCFQIAIESGGLAEPLVLVKTMAHELGHVHLLGHGRLTQDDTDHEPLTDLLLVAFGFGVIAGNAVVVESHQQVLNTYAYQIQRSGYLTMPMFGYALALFARIRKEPNPPWARQLRPDVRQAFLAGERYLDRRGDPVPRRVAARRVEIPRPMETVRNEVVPKRRRCLACGTSLSDPVEYCSLCQESIAHNEKALLADEQAARDRPFWTKIGPFFLLALLAVVLLGVLGAIAFNTVAMFFGRR